MPRDPRSIFAKEHATAVVDSARIFHIDLSEELPLSVDGA